MSPEISSPEHTTFIKRATAAMVAALALSGCMSSNPETAPIETPRPTAAVETPLLPPTPACKPVPDAAQSKVTALLSHPHEFTYYLPDKLKRDKTEDQLWEKRQIAAERYGLTIYDYRKEFAWMEDDLDAEHDPKQPVSRYLKAAEEFSNRYGVDLSVPQVVPENSYGMKTKSLDINNLTAEQAKEMRFSLLDIINNLGELPVEFIKTTGLKRVYIVSILDTNTAGFADYIKGDNFYVDGTKRLPSATFDHELTHLWDAAICGNDEAIFNDPGFDKLNPAKIYSHYPVTMSETDRKDYASYDSVLLGKQAHDLLNKMQEADISGDKKASKAALTSYKKLFAKVVVTQNYSFTNIAEDKATIGEELFAPYDYTLKFNSDDPVLDHKFTYLMARLYNKDPRIARYFIEVGNNIF